MITSICGSQLVCSHGGAVGPQLCGHTSGPGPQSSMTSQPTEGPKSADSSGSGSQETMNGSQLCGQPGGIESGTQLCGQLPGVHSGLQPPGSDAGCGSSS